MTASPGVTMTTTDHAARIRADLKRLHGWTSRQVSVRAEYFSLGSSIEIVIKDPAIPRKAVKAIAEPAERLHRCEITGEILGGGNRYLSVRYSNEAQAIHGRRYADAVQRAVNLLEPGSSSLVPVEGTTFLVGLPNAGRISLWEDSYITDGYTVDAVAQYIGALMVNRSDAD